jgi:hypothetical protein
MKLQIQNAIADAFNAAGNVIREGVTLKILTGTAFDPIQRIQVTTYAETTGLRASTGSFTQRERENWGAQVGDRKALIEGKFDQDTTARMVIDGEEFEVISSRNVLDVLTIFQIRK